MKKKFLSALEIKCKDMGLTKNALNELTELGAKSLKDDATDDDINAAVDSLVPFAKAMQSEITRKTSRKPSTTQSTDTTGEGGEGDKSTGGANTGGTKPDDAEPEWAKSFRERLDALETENKQLKAEKAASERTATIAAKAKTLGIPDFMLKRISIPEDADIDAELTSLKQDLVNANLMPKGQAHENGNTEAQDIADAEAWAKSLPDRQ